MKTSQIIMDLTKAIAHNRDANQELLLSAQNAMFRLYEFTHLDGLITNNEIDRIAGFENQSQLEFDSVGNPTLKFSSPEVRDIVRNGIRTSIDLLDKRKGFSDEPEHRVR